MNAKKCKALRRIVGLRDQKVQYNIPPLVPVYILTPDEHGKPVPTFHHFKTATVTLPDSCARALYRRLKITARDTLSYNHLGYSHH